MTEKKEQTPEEAAKAAQAANSKSVDESINAWRATQGLPPLDRSKEARK